MKSLYVKRRFPRGLSRDDDVFSDGAERITVQDFDEMPLKPRPAHKHRADLPVFASGRSDVIGDARRCVTALELSLIARLAADRGLTP